MSVLVSLVYAAVAVCSVVLIVLTAGRGRTGPVAGPRPLDRSEAAFLAGGPARAVDAALAALHADGRVAVGGPGIVSVVRPQARDTVERAVLDTLAAAPNGALHTVRLAAMRHPAVQEVGDGLAARGLLVTPGRTPAARGLAVGLTAGSVLLVFLGIPLTVVQIAVPYEPSVDGFPVPFVLTVVPAAAVGLLVGGICRGVLGRRTTRAGTSAREEYRAAYAGTADPGVLVAVHGLRGLPDPVLSGQLLAAVRMGAGRGRGRRRTAAHDAGAGGALLAGAVVWCASAAPGGGDGGGWGCGGGSGGGGGGGSNCG
ncbi:TIGR04222 domain-containing membrane protein, partial [Streptomyces solincola]